MSDPTLNPQHEQVKTPGWDTKLRCACGFEANTRREMENHLPSPLVTALAALLHDCLAGSVCPICDEFEPDHASDCSVAAARAVLWTIQEL